MPGLDLSLGTAVEASFAGEFFCAKRDQVAVITKQRACRRLGLDQFAVGGENRRGMLHIFEQTARPFGQGKILAGAFSRYDQYGRAVLRERDARAHTYQRPTDTGPETA